MMKFYYYFYTSIQQNIPVPIIAAINDPAIGAGACLSLICDFRTASIQYTKLGLNL
jgi:enoyl-CoA hydratase/carnithine racemase